MTKVLEIEPLIDETLSLLTTKLDANFIAKPANAKKICMMDDWLAFCM